MANGDPAALAPAALAPAALAPAAPCLCVPKIVHLHPKSAVGFRCAGQMENVIMRFCLKCYFLPLPRGLLP